MRDVRVDFGAELAEFKARPSACTCCELPPTLAISRLADTSKRVSSRRLRQEFPDRTLTTGGLKAWCARTSPDRLAGGAPSTVLRQYTDQHNRPAPVGPHPFASTTSPKASALAANW
jgi:putative transposase